MGVKVTSFCIQQYTPPAMLEVYLLHQRNMLNLRLCLQTVVC